MAVCLYIGRNWYQKNDKNLKKCLLKQYPCGIIIKHLPK